MIVATTPRLRLRHLTDSDAPWALRLLNEPSFIANIADRGVRTVDEATTYLRDRPIASYTEHGYGMYAVESRTSNEPLGMCGLVRRDALDHPDLGYAFFPGHWGHGYAREAARATLTVARDLGIEQLLAIVNHDNAPSIRLLEALGFQHGHEGKQQLRLDDDGEPVELYALDLT